jgi:hypothetical protein
MICKFGKQFSESALLSCTQTIEVACIVLVSNLSENGETAPSRPREGKQAEPAVALFCLRLDPALRTEFVDDFGNCTTSQSQALGQLAWSSLSALVKLTQKHPFRNRSLLLLEGAGKRA